MVGAGLELLLLQPLRLEGLELAVFFHLRHASLVLLELRPQGSQLFSPCLAHLLVGTEERRSATTALRQNAKVKMVVSTQRETFGIARRSNATARRTSTCSQHTDCCSSGQTRSGANHFNRTTILSITKTKQTKNIPVTACQCHLVHFIFQPWADFTRLSDNRQSLAALPPTLKPHADNHKPCLPQPILEKQHAPQSISYMLHLPGNDRNRSIPQRPFVSSSQTLSPRPHWRQH